eukprot:UN04674
MSNVCWCQPHHGDEELGPVLQRFLIPRQQRWSLTNSNAHSASDHLNVSSCSSLWR